ncbi:hypothetical protein GL213_07875 [Halogeometricum borinquense]|uniref:Uncharacterized protein n=1 Tax=Halogeometricum borinquense TaxID=60847 RepID=A0A6C0UGI8_9EURY|nr:hypothetical protein [Halogeometricum borinquense]QIB74606.1 hypothetical protein G3I44_10100 [Halogeometricum borinquense]QIQ76444.1 hypothetical protein GL213_07875 [Halogeometricum borinquense]
MIEKPSQKQNQIRPETNIEPDETPVTACPYCDRPFRTDRLRVLHVGEAHADEWTPGERDAYESALDEEADELFLYHLKVVAALGSVYAAFIILGIIGFSIAG